MTDLTASTGAYERAGVDIDAANATVAAIADKAATTHTPGVLNGIGAFGGVFDTAGLGSDALLVASTDTCGTKPLVAAEVGYWDNLGRDIIAHGVNDVFVQGARPLFALDTISSGHLEPAIIEAVLDGMVEECRRNQCALLGGETAEVPGLVTGVDVAGTLIGTVSRGALLPSDDIVAGDSLVGLASSGLHTNGYSLARMVAADVGYDAVVPDDGRTLGEALMAPHRSYLPVLLSAVESGIVRAMAHITGGGFIENLPRVLPEGLGARIDTGSWEVPPLFRFLVDHGQLPDEEAYRVFNMGIGMVVVVRDVEGFAAAVDEPVTVVGQVTDTAGVVLA